MASTLLLLVPLLLLLLSSSSSALSPPRRTTILLPVSKDPTTNQYVTRLRQGTPSTLLSLVLDLGARYSWVDCEKNQTSSTFSYVTCKSRDCTSALSKSCSVPDNVCGAFVSNPYIKTSGPGDLAQDAVTIQTTDGFNPRKPLTVPNVTFACGPKSLLQGLTAGSAGMAGLGRTGVALPSKLASSIGNPNKFTLCLPSGGDGVLFFGDGPYGLQYQHEFSSSDFGYTPLLVNPVSTALVSFAGEPSVEYFIKVKAVKVNGKNVPVKSSLLSINSKGKGGTKLSTVDPYTVLESSIYKAVVDAFARESGLRRVKAVAPLGACFDGRKVRGSRGGAQVPAIELVMDGTNFVWYGYNTMVDMDMDGRVLCLGLVDGGVDAQTSIVVGGFQMQDNLLMFDLAKKRLGISGGLPFLQTTCSNFNFTYVP